MDLYFLYTLMKLSILMSNYDVELDVSTRNSLSLIISRITKNSTVLEFGPANGRMTKYLKETLGCTVYAVELDEESAKDASEFCEEILVGDIEKFKWLKKYQDIEFDYIIFADVLEHLYSPETVLTKARTLLKNEGSILMSLPNIAHNAIIMDLINDKFTYRKTGLLDNTHIRFFTKNTLEELITNSGLEIAFETASYAEPQNTEFRNNYADLDSSVALLLSGREFGEVYQFVFEAKNKATDLKIDFLQEDTASLYIDTGNGFNELEKVTTIFNSHKDNVINFTVDSKIFNVKAIRIDPLEIALSLKIENIIVNGIDETNKVKHCAIIIGNNELKFLDSDPQLVIEFDESITLGNVALEYKYLTKNYTVRNEKIELQAQQIQDKDTHIESQAQQIQDKDTHIENQAEQIQDKDTHIENQAQQIQDKDTHIENQAQQIQSLRLKNRIKRLLGMYQSTSLFRKELPNNFAKHFDSKGYLKVNPDVATEIDKGNLKSGLVHFCNSGFDEVLRGERKLLESLPFYNDENYKSIRTDVTQAIDDGRFMYSHYVHYLQFEHKEILKQNKWKAFKYIKNNPSSIKSGLKVLKQQGIKALIQKIKQVNTLPSTSIDNTYKYIEPELTDEIKSEIEGFTKKPLISIIMPVYNVDPKWLDLAIKSIEKQWYENWELCIVDDKSTNKDTVKYLKDLENEKIKIKFLTKNLNISNASNEAVMLATGEYIALLDNDDELTCDALYEVIKVINKQEVDFIYSDEDKLELDGNHVWPLFKPDFSYDLLLSLNYITHLAVIKKDLFDRIDGFSLGADGAQDHDLFLKIIEKTNKIIHIPKILYHWRMLETSTAKTSLAKPYAHNAAKTSVQNHLQRANVKALVDDSPYAFVLDIKYTLPEPAPLVSIIIPTKDGVDLLNTCIKSILEVSTYDNYEIVILNNNSVKKETFDWFTKIQELHCNIRVVEANYKFNWSKLNNHGIKESNGNVFIFLNNDIEIITGDWIERLAGRAIQPLVGTVGALLLFEDGTIQHAGVVVGMNGWADHVYREGGALHMHSPFISPMVARNVLASTGACLAISRKTIEEIGGFDECFLICGSDVEISIRAYEHGYRNIFDANTKLTHFESKTRDNFIPETDFDNSRKAYSKYWESGDPFYNKNLSNNSVIPSFES